MTDQSTSYEGVEVLRECSALGCHGTRWADRPFCEFHWRMLDPLARQPISQLLSKQRRGKEVEHGTWNQMVLPLVIQLARIEGRLKYQTWRRREYQNYTPLRPWA